MSSPTQAISTERLHQALDQATRLIERYERARREPIAITGVSCRLPGGADDPAAYWQMLSEKRDGLREVPPERWSLAEYYDADPKAPGKMYSKSGGFLAGIDQFDPEFFGLSQREAERMDPQQRLLLELVWEALENAGEVPAKLKGSAVGVFVGVCYRDYADIQLLKGAGMEIDVHTGTGVAASLASGRISHFLGVHGPSLTVDTACSSSLLAAHLACQSLRSGECQIAIVGGAQVILSPINTIGLCRIEALGTDKSCRTFDAKADGMVRGEGAGVLVLKRKTDALRDENPIHAYVRGTATNHDGPSSGLTVPNAAAQTRVILDAHKNGGTTPSSVVYVEAHGTGTPLGDPIEIRGLTQAFATANHSGAVHLGSVKSSIGHLEAASGVASLIKVIEVLKHGKTAPQAHFDTLNPYLELPAKPRLVISREAQALPASKEPWLAGVNSFGFSGSNVHVVVEQAALAPRPASSDEPFLLALSAPSKAALVATARAFLRRIEKMEAEELRRFCAWSASRRTQFEQRVAWVGASPAEIVNRLRPFVDGGTRVPGVASGSARLYFLFQDQPSIDVTLERFLQEADESVAAVFRACGEALRARGMTELSDPKSAEPSALRVRAYALQCALCQLWKAWEIAPDAVAFNGAGRFAAGWAAGAYSLEDGLSLVLAADENHGHEPAARIAFFTTKLPALDRDRDVEAPPGEARFWQESLSRNIPASKAEVHVSNGVLWDIAGRTGEANPVLALYQAAADLFMAGRNPAWATRVWRTWRHAPVSTPPFAFQRRRCWLPGVEKDAGLPAADGFDWAVRSFLDEASRWLDAETLSGLTRQMQALPRRSLSTATDFYEIYWETAPLTGTQASPRDWLLVGDDAVTRDLGASLRERGHTVYRATAGEALLLQGESLRLRPDHPDDYRAVLSHVKALHPTFRGVVVHTFRETASARSTSSAVMGDLARSLFFLHQALVQSGLPETRLWCVTQGAVQAVSDTLPASCSGLGYAPLLGMARTLSLEKPDLWGGLFDTDSVAQAGAALQEEVVAVQDDIIVHRRSERRVARLRPRVRETGATYRASPEKTYLVTGGLGAIGLTLAEWLIERGARHLVLLSRREPDAAQRERLAWLQTAGATVTHVPADVASSQEMEALLTRLQRSQYPLGGVIHAAGVPGYADTSSLDWIRFAAVLSAKAEGVLLLHRLTRDLPLDLFLMVSSIASAWGSQHQLHYAAANSVLDALAWHRRRLGLPALTINLGPWRGGGMTGTDGLRQLEEIGLNAIDAASLLPRLAGLIASGCPQVVHVRVAWDAFHPVMNARRARPLLAGLAPQRRSPVPAATSAWDRASLDKLTRSILAEVLRTPDDAFPADRTFFELGMDSILAIEFKDTLATRLELPLGASLVFQYSTLHELVAHLAEQVCARDEAPPIAEVKSAPQSDGDAFVLEAEIARLEKIL